MSEQGFRGVPGVPDGWELIGIRYACENEYFLSNAGKIERWVLGRKSDCVLPIIRKIERPKQYRPFESAEEYVANRLERFAVDWKTQNDLAPGFFAVVSANKTYCWVAFGDAIEKLDWEEAFESLQFRHVDNSTSPFGIEVTE